MSNATIANYRRMEMGIWNWFFGKEKKQESFIQKDNMGTLQDTLGLANSYWLARTANQVDEPFAVFIFDNETDAKNALLEVDYIHIAEDTGKLICSETLIYGYYPTENNKYEAIIAGHDLTHSQWESARKSFLKHNGTRKNDQEPSKQNKKAAKPSKGDKDKVKYIREDRQVQMGQTMTYRIYSGPNEASAKAFLQENPVDQQFYFLVVETPEGNYCRDIQGIYKE